MIETSKRAEWLGISSLAIAAVFCLATISLTTFWAHSRALEVLCVPLGVAVLYSILAWWHGRLVRRMREEQLDHERLRQDYDRSDLFDDKDQAFKLATEAHRSYIRYFVPGFTLFAGLALLGIVALLAARWGDVAWVKDGRDALGVAGISFFMAVFCLLAGSFFNGIAKEKDCQFQRPVGAWLMFSGAGFVVVVMAMLAEQFEVGAWDSGAAHVIQAFMILFGVELIVNFIMEFYRPRVRGEESRAVYESRLLYLVTEPGGIARNVAHSLDYQFGFKVSETWFYTFLERSVLKFLLLLLLAFYGLDCFVRINHYELAIKERFGRQVAGEPLQPGLHLKMPWPIDRIRRFPVKTVHTINIGFSDQPTDKHGPEEPGDPERQGDPTGRVVVWDKTHYASEAKFLVASSEQLETGQTGDQQSSTIPVNFLAAAIPVAWKISENPNSLYAYAYNYGHPERVLENIASREIVEFLASVDFIEILGAGRLPAKSELERRIRAAIDATAPPLGVELLFVGLMGVHPSIEVAPRFQDVIGAVEQKQTKILEAEASAARTRNEASGASYATVAGAEAYAVYTTEVAESEAARFLKQLSSYRQCPEVYRRRAVLDLLVHEAKDVRKFVMATDGAEVITIDLQETLRQDLLNDLDLSREY